MQQTLLALCAVLIFSIYALNSTRDEAATEMRSVSAGADEAAASVARARLAVVERLAFDELDVGRVAAGGSRGIRTTPTNSVIGPDDLGEVDMATFDDLDDLHGFTETRAVEAGTVRTDAGASGMLEFALVYRVRYVNPAAPAAAAASPTLAKEIHIEVREVGARGRAAARFDLRRVYTPAGMASYVR